MHTYIYINTVFKDHTLTQNTLRLHNTRKMPDPTQLYLLAQNNMPGEFIPSQARSGSQSEPTSTAQAEKTERESRQSSESLDSVTREKAGLVVFLCST